mmetsp:Transcript_18992/g.28293  ORF Transcript_18992/g.28293 Transcript_18992/m.28293 type:complete len:101 (-) Transcript_18992:107-409(-)
MHDYMWNMKYLPGFKWDHLTEKINYDRAVREQKLRTEIRAAKRQNDDYMMRVHREKLKKIRQEREKNETSKEKNKSKEKDKSKMKKFDFQQGDVISTKKN